MNIINLPKIVKDLIRSGYSEASLADAVGSSQSTIHRIKQGESKNPGYLVVESLQALHKKRCKNKRKAA